MNRRRRLDPDHPAYDPGSCGPNGRAQCRRCLRELPHAQASYCSRECEHEARMRMGGAYVRQAVFARDHGVCMHCRLPCGKLDRIIAALRRLDEAADVGHAEEADAHAVAEPGPAYVASARPEPLDDTARWVIAELGMGRRARVCSLWQADHRIAFSVGGADCGLGNYRTLCLACHQVQTRELHRSQACQRRE